MTEHQNSLVDEYEESDEGAQDLAAASLASQVVDLLHKALKASDLDQKALAAKLGVSEGRISQVVNGDGNLRIAAVARYLRALGYTPSISAQPVEPERPELESPSRGRHDPSGTRIGLRTSPATYHAGAVILPLVGAAMSKHWLHGHYHTSSLADVAWSEAAAFNVDFGRFDLVPRGAGRRKQRTRDSAQKVARWKRAMTDPQPISDPKELIALTELQDVLFWEVSAKRNEEDSEDQPLQIQAMWRLGDQQLGLRFRATLRAEGGDFTTDAEAIFALAEEREVAPEVIQEFIEHVGIMVVFPFIHSTIAESATKLSLPRPVLNLIRANQAQFSK